MVDKTNARAKAAGGYRVMQPIIKNKAADVYYRRAIEAETDKMLTAILPSLRGFIPRSRFPMRLPEQISRQFLIS